MSRKGPGSRIKTGKTWNGRVEGDRGNKDLDMDTVRLLKTQDLGYVRTMKQVAVKERARLEEQFVLMKGLDQLAEEDDKDEDDDDFGDSDSGASKRRRTSAAPRKIVFADDEAEREEIIEIDEDKKPKQRENQDEAFDRAENLGELKRKLEHSRKKVKALMTAESKLEVQQAKMAKTATSGGTTRRGKKIMVRQRKR